MQCSMYIARCTEFKSFFNNIMSDLVDLIVNSYVNAVQAKLCNRFCKFVYLDLCWLVVGSYLCLCVLHYFPSLVLLGRVASFVIYRPKNM